MKRYVEILVAFVLGLIAATVFLGRVVLGGVPGTLGPATPGLSLTRIYTDANSPDNHYYPSGWMGDWGDLKVNESYMVNPKAGTTCIRIDYSAKKSNGAQWAGIFWQYPRDNWGGLNKGYDMTGAKKLIFWARGEKGGERIDKFQFGGIQGRYADTAASGIGPVVLSNEWRRYEIDLTGKDLSRIIGGFMFVANAKMNPEGFVIYLDDIRVE